MSNSEDTIAALEAVVFDLLARIAALESATGDKGGESNMPLGLRLSDFQRDLEQIIPEVPADADLVTTPGATPPADNDLLIWDDALGTWKPASSTEQLVVIDINWDGASLTMQRQLVRIITAADPGSAETIVTSELCE